MRVRQIVTDSLDKAKDIYERLLKGDNFAKLAINHSLSPDRARGGDLGYFEQGTYPKVFDEYCFKLKKGELSSIVKSDYGYHIFKLLDKKPAGRKTLAEVTSSIYQRLYEQKLKAKYDIWLQGIAKDIEVVVEDELLKEFIL